VDCVCRLSDGLALINRELPSVILLDLNLPDSQGDATFRKVLENAPGVPVVILSGRDDEALAMNALNQGVQDYLVKDAVTSRELDRAMRHAVERQALLRSLEMSRKQQAEFKNKVLSQISHELSSPVACIRQFATSLLEGWTCDASQQEKLRGILKYAEQLGGTVRGLLEATRMESGKIRLERCCVSIADSIRQAVAMMGSLADEKGVRLEIGPSQPLPFVDGDPDRILEILVNLIDNAIKFTPAKGAVIVQVCRGLNDPDLVRVSVVDTGCGIRPEAQELIFERLYQDAEAAGQNANAGLGLGLFVVRELVKLHGGSVGVMSEPGNGSAFSFTLPLYRLDKHLFPVITCDGPEEVVSGNGTARAARRLCDSLVLLRLSVKARPQSSRSHWKEACNRVRLALEDCVSHGPSLLLPAMASSGLEQTFYAVAATDPEHAQTMLAQIRARMTRLESLRDAGEFDLSLSSVPLAKAEQALETQVQKISDSVTKMMREPLGAS
jgi:signal transduction histidine kinase